MQGGLHPLLPRWKLRAPTSQGAAEPYSRARRTFCIGRAFFDEREGGSFQLSNIERLCFRRPALDVVLRLCIGCQAVPRPYFSISSKSLSSPILEASAYCTVIKALSPSVEVIGVQSELAPAFYRSWKERRMLEMPSSDTFAEGLQTRVPFQLTMDILWDRLDDSY